MTPLLAHGGGLPELAVFLVPVAIMLLVMRRADRKAKAHERDEVRKE